MRIGRNDPCPCGSGKKFKHCHARAPSGPLALPNVPAPQLKPPPAAPARPIKRRTCSGCTACCGPAMRINKPYLVVPRGESCPHVCSTGCTRWGADLPSICQEFLCNYLIEPGRLSTAERPDYVGVIPQRTHDRLTRLPECLPGGLMRILRNPVWGPIIRRDVRSGRRLLISFVDDVEEVESFQVTLQAGELLCALPLCREDGTVVRVLDEPVYTQKLYRVAILSDRAHLLNARSLIAELGDQDSVVVRQIVHADGSPPAHFRVTRRQADLLLALHPPLRSLNAEPAPARGTADVTALATLPAG